MVCPYCDYGEKAIVLGPTILKWIRKIKVCVQSEKERAVLVKWIQVPGIWALHFETFSKVGGG